MDHRILKLYYGAIDPLLKPLRWAFHVLKEPVNKIGTILLVVAALYGAWQFFYKPPSMPLELVKREAVPLMEALEKYRQSHDGYPATIREILEGKRPPKLNFIYEGADPSTKGFRAYNLYLGGRPNTYIYHSVSQRWDVKTIEELDPDKPLYGDKKEE